jgi:hypothetical protein
VVQYFRAGWVWLTYHTEQRGRIGDGAPHNFLHSFACPLGKRGAEIGDELIEIEHARFSWFQAKHGVWAQSWFKKPAAINDNAIYD